MQLNPHLAFNGLCEPALRFYEECLGGKIVAMVKYCDTPAADQVPLDWRNKIIHATLIVGDQRLTAADAPPEYYQKPQGFSVLINTADPEEGERLFSALADRGTVRTPLQETFWAHRFGVLEDQFGIPWMINCGKAT